MHDILKFPNSRLIHSLRIQNLHFLFKKKYKICDILHWRKHFFYYKKRFRYAFNENTYQFFFKHKNLDLCLMKIQSSFCFEKIFKSVFNENTDLFCYAEKFLDLYYVLLCKKNFKSIFYKSTNLFCYAEKFSDLYLMKIQISFCSEKFSNLYLMKIHICFVMKKNF